MNPVRVRAAQMEDCATLARLVSQFGYPTDTVGMQQRFAALSASEHRETFVAEYEGQVCGMLGVEIYRVWHDDEPLGHLATVVVEEGYRGRNAGTALLDAAENWLRERSVRRAVLTSASHRTEAHGFYLKHGYLLTGQRFAKTLRQ